MTYFPDDEGYHYVFEDQTMNSGHYSVTQTSKVQYETESEIASSERLIQNQGCLNRLPSCSSDREYFQFNEVNFEFKEAERYVERENTSEKRKQGVPSQVLEFQSFTQMIRSSSINLQQENLQFKRRKNISAQTLQQRSAVSVAANKKSKIWTKPEKTILVGLVFDILFSRGSLFPNFKRGEQKGVCWKEIKVKYDIAISRYMRRVGSSQKNISFDKRSQGALKKRFKILKETAIAEEKAGNPPFFRKLYLDWELNHKGNDIMTA